MNWKTYLIDINTSIEDAMRIMGERRVNTLIVIDSNKIFFGTITDGDFRRAILNQKPITEKISEISNTSSYILEENHSLSNTAIEKNKNEGIFVYPIVNKKSEVIDIFDSLRSKNTKEKQKLDNKVLILAGGEGKRLQPITKEVPKPLVKIGGRPIMETSIRSMASYGLHNFVISVNYKKEKIIDYFKDLKAFNGKISFLTEEKPLGTIGPFGQMEDLNSPTVVINGDIITKVDFTSLLNFHSKNNADATVCLKIIQNSLPYGVLSTKDLNLLEFNEKPKNNVQINAGIYVFNPNIKEVIGKNKRMDLPELVKKLIKNKMKVICFPIHEYWIDVGEISTLERANLEFNDLEFNFYE